MTERTADSPIFELNASGVHARAQVRGGQFMVLTGSQVNEETAPLLATHSSPRLRHLIAQGAVVEGIRGGMTFTRDTPFNSLSDAAGALLGKTQNGRKVWKIEGTETTYGEWADAKVWTLTAHGAEPPEGTWQPFVHALTMKLLEYEERQAELVSLMRDVGIAVRDDPGGPLEVMDPLTFLLSIEKYGDPAKVRRFLSELSSRLELNLAVPGSLTGFSLMHITDARLFSAAERRTPLELADLFALTRQALAGDLDDETFRRILARKGVGLAKLTQALYGVNPQRFLGLTSDVQAYLHGRGIQGVDRVNGTAALRTVLDAAAQINPDFVALSQAAWQARHQAGQVAQLSNGAFPFAQFRKEALKYSADRAKGNEVLDRRYAPLLLEELGEVPLTHLKPARSPYTGPEQVTLKVALGGSAPSGSGLFARALMFAEDGGFEYVPFQAGLTLELGLLEGKGDGLRRALTDPQMGAELFSALMRPLPTSAPATLTLNTDFGELQLLPLQEAREVEVMSTLEAYALGFEKNRRLRVGVTLSPQELEGESFSDLLEAALGYVDALTGMLERLDRTPDSVPPDLGTIHVPGQAEETPVTFTPVPGVPLNQILYGPPGTGKTYRVIDEALAILDPAALHAHPGPEGRAARKVRYDHLVKEGRVSFVTFHQSFGYEDFIEGIKPVMQEGNLSYEVQDGVFLEAVRAAGGDLPAVGRSLQQSVRSLQDGQTDGQVWRVSMDGAIPVSRVRELALERGEIRLGSWLNGPVQLVSGQVQATAPRPSDLTDLGEDALNSRQLNFRDGMRLGDLVLLATAKDRIEAVGVVTGAYRFDPDSDRMFTADYAHARSVRWLARGLDLSAQAVLGRPVGPSALQRVAGVTPGQVLAHLPAETGRRAFQSHVLIIDEINRGNIAKIFGELITLLESGKRAGTLEALTVTLPLSRRPLSVPQSLYVLGTMNTADRSLTLLDAALRRRFSFRPVWPEPQVLPVLILPGEVALDLRKFLYVINDRIERLLSRDQVIGHAYLLGVPATLDGVASALRERILPLLEEYFFADWGKIREVLADEGKPPELQFIHRTQQAGQTPGSEARYRLNEAAFRAVEAFSAVYAGVADHDFPFSS